jgi:hypothetical protein
VENSVVVVQLYEFLDQIRTNVSDAPHSSGTQKSFFPGVEHVNTFVGPVHYDQAGVKFAPMRRTNTDSSTSLDVTNSAFHHSNEQQMRIFVSVLRVLLERQDWDACFLRYPRAAFETAFVLLIGEAHGLGEKVEAIAEIFAHTVEVTNVVLIVIVSGEVCNFLVAGVAISLCAE